ncbi:SDR family NAD(P)-dependent oxidoreductase [Metabacillus fastidiosus]|uniref:SDR family NAD(P)-dependent oxidoreductase n=1 Tax=Metabacillus fastidiosus TaxID=1458 RepID=UPI003D29EDB9
MLLQDKVAIVTGATRGIGKSVFYRLAEEGATVIGVFNSSVQRAENIQNDMEEKGYSAALYQGSVTNEEFVNKLVSSVVSTYGKIDILVNNAGITRDNIIFNMPEIDWDSVFETNFRGTYICTMAVLPYMLENCKGSVINMASVTGVLGREAQSNYGASKGAMMGLTRLLSRQYASKGIRLNCVAPGMTDTEMIGHVPEGKLNNFLQFTNMKRLGDVKEIADTVLFLASDLSGYFADTVLKADGGFMR